MTPVAPEIRASAAIRSAARWNRHTLLTAGAVVLLIVLLLGYIGLGYWTAHDRLQNAERAYESARDHQLGMFATHRGLSDQIHAVDFRNAAAGDYQMFKATDAQIVSQAKQAQRQIETDDAALLLSLFVLGDAGIQWWVKVVILGALASITWVTTRFALNRSPRTEPQRDTDDAEFADRFHRLEDGILRSNREESGGLASAREESMTPRRKRRRQKKNR